MSLDDERAEMERRATNLRPIETTVIVCLNCGEEIARSCTYEYRNDPERATREPWVDPFAAAGVALFTRNHRYFCNANTFRFRRRARTTEIVVRNVP